MRCSNLMLGLICSVLLAACSPSPPISTPGFVKMTTEETTPKEDALDAIGATEAVDETGATPTAEASMDESFTFLVRIENRSLAKPHLTSGVFDTPTGAEQPGPLDAGAVYEFTFHAPPGSRLSFATMYLQSNDLFYAPGPEGIPLYSDAGNPRSGDVTQRILLWDAGTEVNVEPGFGANQAPRQRNPNTGPDEDGVVVPIPQGYTYPQGPNHLSVSLQALEGSQFRLRIQNIAMDPAMRISPGVWVVHKSEAPLFTRGEPDRGEGLEALAEDGEPTGLAATLAARAGAPLVLSPGVWAVFNEGKPLFSKGERVRGNGLEALAEDGDPSDLAAFLQGDQKTTHSGTFTTPLGADPAAPAGPGLSYEWTFQASRGERLILATMFLESNDWFFAPDPTGIPLFNAVGRPLEGEITDLVHLWDAGTEADQPPGTGPDQAPRQESPNSGDDENGVVRAVLDETSIPIDALAISIKTLP